MKNGNPPVILNFDGSISSMPDAVSLNLTDWQERIRFAASRRAFRALEWKLESSLPSPADCGTYFLGSGDYHHISYLLIKRLRGFRRQAGEGQKLDVVILDNHPDNMRYPFGIHCGSWVSHLAALPFIGHIDVAGITSSDIAIAHAAENRLLPLLRGKLTYWSVGVNVRWAHNIGLGRAFRNFANIKKMSEVLLRERGTRSNPLYFSLDKDVLAPSAAQTNWDQGVMKRAELEIIIRALRPRMIAADIVGEVSSYHYKSIFKRFLSRLDGQKEVSSAELQSWQAAARKLNGELLSLLI